MQLVQQAQLAWRLVRDPRVPGWAKFLPVAALAYLISPLDFIPDAFVAAFGLGVLDDIAIVMLGLKGLIDFSPQHVVAEHRAAIMGLPADHNWEVDGKNAKDAPKADGKSRFHGDDVIDVDVS
jgi:uncharacterized membrane protein YkvA (DUF1232 family)